MNTTPKAKKQPVCKTETMKLVEDMVPTSVEKKAVAKKPREKTTRVSFSVRAEPGSKVFIAGSFNDWNPQVKELLDKKGNGLYACVMCLKNGSHQYKFVINGTWCADPECTDWMQNSMGTLNSVKIID